MIKVENLSKSFRTEEVETIALNGVSFTSMLTPLSATVSTSSVRKILVMFSVLIISCILFFRAAKLHYSLHTTKTVSASG